jgi:hypothetical protein
MNLIFNNQLFIKYNLVNNNNNIISLIHLLILKSWLLQAKINISHNQNFQDLN